MKFKIFKNYIIAASLFMASCERAVDLYPTDSFTENLAFQNLSDLQKHVNNAYSRLSSYNNIIYATSLVSDEIRIGGNNTGSGVLEYQFQYSSDITTGSSLHPIYTSYYAMIDQVNRILKNYDNIEVTPAEETRKSILKGQILALRAMANYELLRFYSKKYDPNDPLGIALMFEPDLFAQPKRNTVGEVKAHIDTDFDAAMELLPAISSANYSDTVFNQLNIKAYQARVSLYTGEYEKAVTKANEVLNANIVTLLERDQYEGYWRDSVMGTHLETLLRFRNATGTGLASSYTLSNGGVILAPSTKLNNVLTENDIRRTVIIKSHPTNGIYLGKYLESSKGQRVVDTKIMRLSEILLIRAEANLLKPSPDLTAATADLNLLRSKRYDPAVDTSFANVADAITYLESERFKELAFEGQRFTDLKRRAKPVERLAADASETWRVLEANSHRFTFPLPFRAITANPNAVQNPGY